MSNRQNRVRAFTDVVSLDAWHDDFVDNGGRARIFADVVFRTARVGGEAECPVRFRLRLKRAEIHLIIPDSEPIRIDPESVARTFVEGAVTRSITLEASRQTSQGAEVGMSIATDTAKVRGISASASRKRGDIAEKKEIIHETREEFSLQVTCTKSPENNYRWEIESSSHLPLKGAPWDASHPRATLVSVGEPLRYGLSPGGIRFEARCAREDMIIEDIEIKDPSLWDRLKQGAFRRTKEMVVEQYIREELIREGLEAENIQDKYGLVTLSSVVANE